MALPTWDPDSPAGIATLPHTMVLWEVLRTLGGGIPEAEHAYLMCNDIRGSHEGKHDVPTFLMTARAL